VAAAAETPAALRAAFRAGGRAAPTGALAPGYMQANLAVVPAALADAFEAFLRANPAACPLLARGRPGDPRLPALGAGIDLRHDLPLYRVYRHGRPAGDVADIAALWRDDLVAFAVGCSLSFEADLVAGGVELRCHGPGVTCSAFDSALPAVAAGPFRCNLVVSMRAVRADEVDRAVAITRAHPQAHGAPVHVGEAAAIGVDLARPIDGIGLTDIRDGEVAVFWACGVTMARALAAAAPALAITHAPGHMLITDLPVRVAAAAGLR
jgi:uncharacterized protein YcsI (UPF0317 family)